MNPWQRYMGSHSVTCHPTQVSVPPLTSAMQAGTRFTYPGGIEGWVDLGVGYIPRRFTCPQTVTHPGTNHLIATRPGLEPTTSWSQVQRPNRSLPSHLYYTFWVVAIVVVDVCLLQRQLLHGLWRQCLHTTSLQLNRHQLHQHQVNQSINQSINQLVSQSGIFKVAKVIQTTARSTGERG